MEIHSSVFVLPNQPSTILTSTEADLRCAWTPHEELSHLAPASSGRQPCSTHFKVSFSPFSPCNIRRREYLSERSANATFPSVLSTINTASGRMVGKQNPAATTDVTLESKKDPTVRFGHHDALRRHVYRTCTIQGSPAALVTGGRRGPKQVNAHQMPRLI